MQSAYKCRWPAQSSVCIGVTPIIESVHSRILTTYIHTQIHMYTARRVPESLHNSTHIPLIEYRFKAKCSLIENISVLHRGDFPSIRIGLNFALTAWIRAPILNLYPISQSATVFNANTVHHFGIRIWAIQSDSWSKHCVFVLKSTKNRTENLQTAASLHLFIRLYDMYILFMYNPEQNHLGKPSTDRVIKKIANGSVKVMRKNRSISRIYTKAIGN